VPSSGVQARCSVCAGVIDVKAESPSPAAPTRAEHSSKHSAPASTVAAPPASGASPVSGTKSERKPINPFLSRDPANRARRLARALISDMVAYHPDKQAQGLREGTLKILFRDEIKKSYDEYVAQVGAEFAESTAYFQDSLNEVLAGGKKVF
jgi:hypothetical protein